MDIIKLLETVQRDWAIVMLFFALGGAWIQGKMWVEKINKNLDRSTTEHGELCAKIDNVRDDVLGVHNKLDTMETRQLKIESQVEVIHEEIHQQEIKLAVLESKAPQRKRRQIKA